MPEFGEQAVSTTAMAECERDGEAALSRILSVEFIFSKRK